MNQSLPTRAFREHTDLNQLKRQAKELLDSFRTGDGAANAEVNAHYGAADPDTFALHDAQLVLARAYGFASWPKLKAYVDGATAKRFLEAVRAGDLVGVQTMLRARPELVNMGVGGDEHRAIHYAVLLRSPEMTRLLMQHGADARAGIHPHREATSAFTLASDRGYDEIVAIIRDEEQRRRETQAGTSAVAAPAGIFGASMWQSGWALRMLQADPALARSTDPEGCTPLHAAASALDEGGISWLLDHGAAPNSLVKGRWTPLDLAASGRGWSKSEDHAKFEQVARLLLSRGASLSPIPAVALGEEEWVRVRHAEGALTGINGIHIGVNSSIFNIGGLLSIAVLHDRPGMLALLLDLGLEPDERIRVDGMDEILYTTGNPLLSCVVLGKRQMAEMLLARGADPNANVYTCGSPLFRAYSQKDWDFVRLLEQHGGLLDAVSAGFACQTEAARQLLADEAAGRLRPGAVLPGSTVSEDLLWTACGGGDPEIVRLALERIDWPRQDSRWIGSLCHAFTCDNVERGLACFRLVLDRADPNQSDSGRTILHTVVAQAENRRVPYAEMLLNQGARTDIRDDLLKSTALGWACRWGRIHFVKLLLERDVDPVETDAEPWATPRAWAQKMKHDKVLAMLQAHGGQSDEAAYPRKTP
jgi:ankyrin repeat protein